VYLIPFYIIYDDLTIVEDALNNSLTPPTSVVSSVVIFTVATYPLIPVMLAPQLISPSAGVDVLIRFA